MQHNHWQRAQDIFSQCLYNLFTSVGAVRTEAQRENQIWWYDGWVTCAKNLSQWTPLKEMAAECQDMPLQVEVSTKLGEWGLLQSVISKGAAAGASPAALKLGLAYSSLQQVLYQTDSNLLTESREEAQKHLNDAERQRWDGVRVLLHQWQRLPPIVAESHVPLLRLCHQYSELVEGMDLLDGIRREFRLPDLRRHAREYTSRLQHQLPLKQCRNVLQQWRNRLPNKWESMISWTDICVWRNFLFTLVECCFGLIVPECRELSAFLHDLPWTMIKLAGIARSTHRQADVAVRQLYRLPVVPHLDSDAFHVENFLGLAQKVKLCLMDEPGESLNQTIDSLKAGINLINSFNFDQAEFSREMYDCYKAQLFKLRANIQLKWANKLRESREKTAAATPQNSPKDDSKGAPNGPYRASSAQFDPNAPPATSEPHPDEGPSEEVLLRDADEDYNVAMRINPVYGQGWLAWGRFADSMFERGDMRDLNYAINAITCYMMGIVIRQEKMRLYMPRVLWLLTYDDEQHHSPISSAFEKHVQFIPHHLWLPFTPNLITGLERHEAPAMKSILCRIMPQYAQAIFCQLRTSVAEKKNSPLQPICNLLQQKQLYAQAPDGPSAAAAAGTAGTNGRGDTGGGTKHQSLAYLEDVTTHCKNKCGSTIQPFSDFVSNVESVFRGDVAEEMLSVIDNILSKFYDLPCDDGDPSQPPLTAPTLMAQVQKTFSRLMINARQQKDKGQRSSLSQPITSAIVALYKDDIIKDFFDPPPAPPRGNNGDNEFLSDGPALQMPVGIAIGKLKKWKDLLTRQLLLTRWHGVSDDLSPYFQPAHNKRSVEIPGIYWKPLFAHMYSGGGADSEHFQGHTSGGHLDRMSRYCPLVLRNGVWVRRMTLISQRGDYHSFILQTCHLHQQAGEVRMVQLHLMLNTLLSKCKDTRRRGLCLSIHTTVPISPRLRLIEDHPSAISFQEIYDDFITNRRPTTPQQDDGVEVMRDPEYPILLARRLMANARRAKREESEKRRAEAPAAAAAAASAPATAPPAAPQADDPDTHRGVMEQVYEVMGTTIGLDEYLLRDYLHRSALTADASFHLSKRFIIEYGILAFLAHMFKAGGITPAKLHVLRSTGQVQQYDLRPSLQLPADDANQTQTQTAAADQADPQTHTPHPLASPLNFQLHCEDRVPFRLTRNVQALMGPHGLLGLFPAVLFSMGECLFAADTYVVFKSYLALILRDDYWIYCLHHRSQQLTTLVDQLYTTHMQRKHSTATGATHGLDKEVTSQAEREAHAQAIQHMTVPAPRGLAERVMRIVDDIYSQVRLTVTGSNPNTIAGGVDDDACIDQRVMDLIRRASTHANLMQQPPKWHPWL
mmetsp:Transcript_42441/g.120433  ORF Transcript_42441/g.120433 Transcript_42441/m.120433 type:complete len:1352 (+) Transcript_42441:224-4279(+)